MKDDREPVRVKGVVPMLRAMSEPIVRLSPYRTVGVQERSVGGTNWSGLLSRLLAKPLHGLQRVRTEAFTVSK